MSESSCHTVSAVSLCFQVFSNFSRLTSPPTLTPQCLLLEFLFAIATTRYHPLNPETPRDQFCVDVTFRVGQLKKISSVSRRTPLHRHVCVSGFSKSWVVPYFLEFCHFGRGCVRNLGGRYFKMFHESAAVFDSNQLETAVLECN